MPHRRHNGKRLVPPGGGTAMSDDCCCGGTPHTCHAIGNCCFSNQSRVAVTITGNTFDPSVWGVDPCFPECVGLSFNYHVELEFHSIDTYGAAIWGDPAGTWVSYGSGGWGGWYIDPAGNQCHGILNLHSGDTHCCNGTMSVAGGNECIFAEGTASVAVLNNKCCKCGSGGCSKTSDGSDATCGSGGTNDCTDLQDDNCPP